MGQLPPSTRSGPRSPRPEEVWSQYRANLARHLIGVSRDLEFRVVRSLTSECGYQDLRPSFGPLLSLIWDEPKPLSGVAEELAISPQASSQLANRVEAAGYVRRQPHPVDRRSKVVALTRRGRSLVEEGVRLILACESEYSLLLGPRKTGQFVAALADLYEGLALPNQAEASLGKNARRSVGVLPLIAVRIQRELMKSTIVRGHPGLKMSHGQVLPLMGAGGGRVVEIARIQGVSRQAISAISKDLESLGYLRRESDPRDGRGVVLRLTVRGEALIEDSVTALDELETLFRGILGDRRLRQLQIGARELYGALHVEAGIFDATGRDEHTVRSAVQVGGPRRRTIQGESGPIPTDGANARKNQNELRELASRLRQQLGKGDAARLGLLLGPETRRTMT